MPIYADEGVLTSIEVMELRRGPERQRQYLNGPIINIAKKLSDLVQLKGIDALRVNQLFDGES